MSRRERGLSASRFFLTLASLLLLTAVVLFAGACESLDSATANLATTSTELPAAADISVLFGDWEGTYTPEAAWDENGTVDDPPFELGTPVAMSMELHPWSAGTASFGTIDADELSPARVASLALEGDQVTVVAVTETAGLDDMIGIFTLTLDGDTLTGSDDAAPQVPSGWISTSGTMLLRRVAPWDPSAASETTESTAASDHADDADDGGGVDDGADGDGPEPLPGVEIVPDPETITLHVDDNWGSSTVRVGDEIILRFTFAADAEVSGFFCNSTSSVILDLRPVQIATDPATGYIPGFYAHFDAIAPGSVDIIFRATEDDDSVYLFWRYHVTVVE